MEEFGTETGGSANNRKCVDYPGFSQLLDKKRIVEIDWQFQHGPFKRRQLVSYLGPVLAQMEVAKMKMNIH